MALAYRSSATAGDSSGGNLTINKPTGTADGDIMIMSLYREAGTWTLPAGWTQIVEARDDGSDAIYLTVAWKRASSEGSSYSVTLSTTTWRMGAISSFSGGLASGDPIDTYATDATAVDVARLASITTTVANTMLVGIFSDYNGAGCSAGTSGMTEVVGPATLSVLYVAKAATGSTGQVTGFSGGLLSSGWASVHLAIKPATSGGTTYNQSAAGTVTPAGALSRSAQKKPAGSVTPTGSVRKLTGKKPAGSMAPTGSVRKTTFKNLAGTVSLAGALAAIRTAIVTAGGSLGLSGTLARQTTKSVVGSLSPSGTLARRVGKALSGALAPVGSLISQFVGLYAQAVGGTLGMSGNLTRSTRKLLSGEVAPSGGLVKRIGKALSGALGLAGSMLHNLFGPSAWLADVTLADDLTYTVTLADSLTYTVAIGNSLTYTVALEDEPA